MRIAELERLSRQTRERDLCAVYEAGAGHIGGEMSTIDILTAEEHSTSGGLGSAIAQVVVAEAPVPMKILGVPSIFVPTGSAKFLLDELGMAPSAIARSVSSLVARKSAPR
jgi:transketolase